MTTPDSTFTSWLYRPYLDLTSNLEINESHLGGIEIDYLSLTKAKEFSRIGSNLVMSSFREILINQVGLFDYPTKNPLAVPESYHTDRWKAFIGYLRSYQDLSAVDQLRTVRLLTRLAFYDYLINTVPKPSSKAISKDANRAEIAYLIVLSKHFLGKESRIRYSIGEMEEIASLSPLGSVAKVESTYDVAVQHIKINYDLGNAQKWVKRHLTAIEVMKGQINHMEYSVLKSRYYRLLGFIPQMQNDKKGTSTVMNLCERWAQTAREEATTFDEENSAKIVWYAVIEGRTKEALRQKDLQTAGLRARELTKIHPTHPRAYLTLGQILIEQRKIKEAKTAYRNAIHYSPQGLEVASFMLGQCFEVEKNYEEALDYYLSSLTHDSLGISAIRKVQNLAEQMKKNKLYQWSYERINSLTRDKIKPANHIKPYQGGLFKSAA